MPVVGEEFDVRFRIENVSNLKALNIELGYDPGLLEVIDEDPDIPMTQVISQDLGFIPDATLDCNIAHDGETEFPGTLVCAYTSDETSSEVLTDGLLFTVKMKGLQRGVHELTILNVNAMDDIGEIPSWPQNGEVELTPAVARIYVDVV